MIRLFKTHYLKSRVIGLSYQVDKVMTEMAKQSFENPDEYFLKDNPSQYYECKFINHISRRWGVDAASFSKYEIVKYEESLKKFNQFRELDEFMENMSDFTWELKTLYLEIQRELNTPNFWNRRETVTHTFETQVHDSLRKYIKLINDLNKNPDWQAKAKDEIGYYASLIYSSLSDGGDTKAFDNVFTDFDKQYYFK